MKGAEAAAPVEAPPPVFLDRDEGAPVLYFLKSDRI